MTTVIQNNRLYVTDAGGAITFDTNDSRLVWTDFVSSSVVRPAYTSSSSGFSLTAVDTTETVNLSAISANATVAFGMCQTVWSSNPSWNFGASASATTGSEWLQVTGTLIEAMTFGTTDGSVTSTEVKRARLFKGLLAVTFRCAGGQLQLVETCKLRCYVPQVSGTYSVTYPSRTLNYRILCGYFQ